MQNLLSEISKKGINQAYIERNQNDYSFLIGFFLNKEILNEYKLTKSLIEVETQCKDKPKIRKTKI